MSNPNLVCARAAVVTVAIALVLGMSVAPSRAASEAPTHRGGHAQR